MTLSSIYYCRDSRFTDESCAFNMFLMKILPSSLDSTIEAMRTRAETLHSKVNEKWIDVFDGAEEERKICISDAGSHMNVFH